LEEAHRLEFRPTELEPVLLHIRIAHERIYDDGYDRDSEKIGNRDERNLDTKVFLKRPDIEIPDDDG
jgi:hypothetical protein